MGEAGVLAIQPSPPDFEEDGMDATVWECYDVSGCKMLDKLDADAGAEINDVEKLKSACLTQLKRKGIDVKFFLVEPGEGGAKFFGRGVEDLTPAQWAELKKNKVDAEGGEVGSVVRPCWG